MPEENNIQDLEGEVWRDVLGYEGYYQVSNMGRIKSLSRSTYHFKNKERLFKMNPEKDGGIRVFLSKDLKNTRFQLHRLVAFAFIPNPKNLPFINHISGNRADNRVENLEWVTPSENILHAYRIGLKNAEGMNNGQAKLKDEDIIKIKQLYKDGVFQKEIAKIFNVCRPLISMIVCNKIWKHLL